MIASTHDHHPTQSNRYEAFLTRLLPLDVPPSTNTTIPRIIHHIWLGSTFPARFEAWRASYREHHPGRSVVTRPHK